MGKGELVVTKHWTDSVQTLVRQNYGQNLTVPEFQQFKYVSEELGLDPLRKEIWPIKFMGKNPRVVYITSIEGYVKLASRTGKFRGFKPPGLVVRDSKGDVVEIPLRLYDPNKHTEVLRAVARVVHADFEDPQEYSADASFYTKKGEDSHFWTEGKTLMLYKCAQALALRRTFSSDLGGLYTNDEMNNIVSNPDDFITVKFEEVALEAEEKPEPPKPKKQAESSKEKDPHAAEKKWTTIDAWLRKQGCSDDSILYALDITKSKFNVSDISDIEDVEELGAFARGVMLHLMKDNGYLPARK